MTDHEDELASQLSQTLLDRTASLNAPADLSTSVRELRKSRVRSRLIAGAGALVVATGLAFTVPGIGGEDATPAPADTSTVNLDFDGRDWIPDGFRTETYGAIEMAIPQDWGYGDLSQWCIFPDLEKPVYDRPGGVSTLVGCSGPGGYGVQFTDPREVDPDATSEDPFMQDSDGQPRRTRDFPEGSAVRTKVIGDLMVLLVLPDARLADQIIATVHEVTGVDANGCPGRVSVPAIGRAATVAAKTGPISVCRYSGKGRDAVLIQSELLDPDDSAALRAAIESAPRGVGPGQDSGSCNLPDFDLEAVLLRADTGPLAWVHYADCGGAAVDLGSSTRKVTGDVLHWSFSPGWSGFIPDGLKFDPR